MVFHLRRANDHLHENMSYVKDSIDFIYSVMRNLPPGSLDKQGFWGQLYPFISPKVLGIFPTNYIFLSVLGCEDSNGVLFVW